MTSATQTSPSIYTPDAGMSAQEVARQEILARELARRRLLPFVNRNIPNYKAGWVHKLIAIELEKFLEAVVAGESPRLMIFMPPRHGKSELASRQFPAWALGKYPWLEFIISSYSGDLAKSFSRSARGLIRTNEYAALFPETRLDPDNQSVERWQTLDGGAYMPSGVDGTISGYGGHIFIVDDPHKNRKEAESKAARRDAWDFYSSTALTRLAPGGGIIVIQTRWHVDDISGRLLNKMRQGADQWRILSFPAIATMDEIFRRKGEALHPARYDLKALEAIQAMQTKRDWEALYQQSPIVQEGAILKEDYWCRWESDQPPKVEYIIQTVDTAYGQNEQSDWNVISTWGIFYPQGKMPQHTVMFEGEPVPDEERRFDGKKAHLILLDVVRNREQFPQLKKTAKKLYEYWQPDHCIIENKASGISLIQEMRHGGFPVSTYTPNKGEDKVARANAVSDIFSHGMVWAPRTEWADQLITECNNFPSGLNDDCVDVTTLAVMRYRRGGFIQLESDYEEEFVPRKVRQYY